MFTLLLLLTGVATLWATKRRIQSRRLRRPMLKGVHLPTVDDVRWKEDRYGNSVYRLGAFKVNSYNGEVQLDGSRVGKWTAYARALEQRFDREHRERLHQLALTEIEQAE